MRRPAVSAKISRVSSPQLAVQLLTVIGLGSILQSFAAFASMFVERTTLYKHCLACKFYWCEMIYKFVSSFFGLSFLSDGAEFDGGDFVVCKSASFSSRRMFLVSAFFHFFLHWILDAFVFLFFFLHLEIGCFFHFALVANMIANDN